MWTARVIVFLPLVVFPVFLCLPADTLVSFLGIHQENLLKPYAELARLRNTVLIAASVLGLLLAWWSYHRGRRKVWDRCALALYGVLSVWSIGSVVVQQIDHI